MNLIEILIFCFNTSLFKCSLNFSPIKDIKTNVTDAPRKFLFHSFTDLRK